MFKIILLKNNFVFRQILKLLHVDKTKINNDEYIINCTKYIYISSVYLFPYIYIYIYICYIIAE